MEEKESVIKFNSVESENRLIDMPDINELNYWRRELYKVKLVGKNDKGEGYGNLSQLLPPYNGSKNKKAFVITGSQTGGLEDLTEEHYAIITAYYPEKNIVEWQSGSIKPSSESMTHGALYDLDESLRFIFHSHCSTIWSISNLLGIPLTNANAKYGTPEMAKEIERLFESTDVKDKGIFSMGGHEDGIFTFGRTAGIAGSIILRYLREAYYFSQE